MVPGSSGFRSSPLAVVLVVEYHDDVREAFRLALTHAGFTVIDVSDGAAALHVLKSVRPAAIVIDTRQALLDGYSLRAELAAKPTTNEIPVVAIVVQRTWISLA